MALNPSTNATMNGRITAADADYPYGSSKNESAPGAGDGTPYFKARADDIFGLQQALLRVAGITPSGNADTARESEYLQALIQLALGRASLYDDTGVADAYIIERRTNQQVPDAVFEGMRFAFVPDNANTGASTADISDLLNEPVGTTVLNIKLAGGVTDPNAGDVVAGVENFLTYRTAPSAHLELTLGSVTLATKAEAQAQTDNIKYMSALRVLESFEQHGLGIEAPVIDYEETVDANNLVKGGFYTLSNTAANGPDANNYQVLVIARSTTNTTQIAFQNVNPDLMYVRSRNSGVWGSWIQLTPIGVSQTWTNVTGSRSNAVTYTNTTGRPIMVVASSSDTTGADTSITLQVNGTIIFQQVSGADSATSILAAVAIIPDGATYEINIGASETINRWWELR